MSAKKGLGRGFSSLIPTELLDDSFDPTAAQDEKLSELRELPLAKVEPNPDQPRRSFDEMAIEELAASINQHGVVQPIVVTPQGDKYQIVAGERRYRASIKAGKETIPALVRTMTDQHKLEVSLIENLQRRDLNVLETATAYLKLRDQFNLTLDEIGARVGGKSVSAISNTLRLLRLPESVRKALHDGRLREGQARPLVGIDEDIIESVLPQILKEEWSARKIEQFIVDLKKAKKDESKVASKAPSPQHEAAIQHLSTRLNTKVQIRSNTRGSGQIVITFSNEEDLARINDFFN